MRTSHSDFHRHLEEVLDNPEHLTKILNSAVQDALEKHRAERIPVAISEDGKTVTTVILS